MLGCTHANQTKSHELSLCANRFEAKLQKIQEGKILSKICLNFCSHKISVLLPNVLLQKALQEQELKEKQMLECFLKASDISLKASSEVEIF